MKKYAFYNSVTMEVYQVSSLPESDLVYYKDYIEFTLDTYNPSDFSYRVVNGLVIKKERRDNFYLKQKAKQARQIKLNNIEVNYNNIIYQGDEVSQDRMSRAINGLPDEVTTIDWKAKDNTTKALNKIDLKQILYLAGQEQTKIWFS